MLKTSLQATLLLTALCTFTLPASASGWSPCPGFERGAEDQNHTFFFSPYTHHWRDSEEHREVVLLGLKRHLPNDRSCGMAVFSNSFGQPSLYAFTGWSWPQLSTRLPNWFASVTAGILYGYVEPHEDKVPLNVEGFSPAIIPTIGYRLTDQTAVEWKILGNAALMFSVSRRF